MILLVGDLGGTNSTLYLVSVNWASQAIETLFQASYLSRRFSSVELLLQTFLQTAKGPAPSRAYLAVAGPVVHQRCQLTNLGWTLAADHLMQVFDWDAVHLINDFVAVGHGLASLNDRDVHTLQAGHPQQDSPIAVIGAGTGLGEGIVIPSHSKPQRSQVFATEGGHCDFAPPSPLAMELGQYLQQHLPPHLQKNHPYHLSVERVVSGPGIVAIYQFFRDRHPEQSDPEIAALVQRWERGEGDPEILEPAAAIAQAALQKRDRRCEKTLDLFLQCYGAEAGNLALKLLPYGGLYIAGGIARKILPLMKNGHFLRAFNAKGRMGDLLAQIPVYVILNPLVGVLGAVVYGTRYDLQADLKTDGLQTVSPGDPP